MWRSWTICGWSRKSKTRNKGSAMTTLGACASSGTTGSTCKGDPTRTSTDLCSSCPIRLLISSATVRWTSTSTRQAMVVRGAAMQVVEAKAPPSQQVDLESDLSQCFRLWDLSTKPFRERKVKPTILYCLKRKMFPGLEIDGSKWTGAKIHQGNGLCKASLMQMPMKSGDCILNAPRTSWRVCSSSVKSHGSCISKSLSSLMEILKHPSPMRSLQIPRVL